MPGSKIALSAGKEHLHMQHIQLWLRGLGNFLLTVLLPTAFLLAGGIFLIRSTVKLLQKTLSRYAHEPAVSKLIVSCIKVLLYGLLVLILASRVGLDVTGIVALASVLTLAISLAIQSILSNVISGFTLLYTKPFRTGDYVEVSGQAGTVKAIGLTYTELTTPDQKNILIPNSAVTAAQIVNYTVLGTRRVEISVCASYDSPMDAVLEALLEAAHVDTRLPDKIPFAAVNKYAESSIEYVLHVWTTADDYWTTLFEVNKRIREVFDAKGLRMTYPHLKVHLDK